MLALWDKRTVYARHCGIYTSYGAGDAVSDEGEGGEVSEKNDEEKEGSVFNKDNEIDEERAVNFFNCLLATLLSYHEASNRAVRLKKR